MSRPSSVGIVTTIVLSGLIGLGENLLWQKKSAQAKLPKCRSRKGALLQGSANAVQCRPLCATRVT